MPSHCPGKQKEERAWTEQKEQILNTSLLNPSAQNKIQNPGAVREDLGQKGVSMLRECPTRMGVQDKGLRLGWGLWLFRFRGQAARKEGTFTKWVGRGGAVGGQVKGDFNQL